MKSFNELAKHIDFPNEVEPIVKYFVDNVFFDTHLEAENYRSNFCSKDDPIIKKTINKMEHYDYLRRFKEATLKLTNFWKLELRKEYQFLNDSQFKFILDLGYDEFSNYDEIAAFVDRISFIYFKLSEMR